MLNILLVDDHELFRVGIKMLLTDFAVDAHFAEANNCTSATALAATQRFDVVLLDLGLPGVSGMQALMQIRQSIEDAAIVVLSGEDDPVLIRKVIDAGAAGYIPKNSSPALMIAALRVVLAGGTYLPPHVLASGPLPLTAASTTTTDGLLLKLSERQIETLRYAMQGKPNKVIARDMQISEATVKAHLATAFRVLGVKNRTEAVFVAARAGLQTPV